MHLIPFNGQELFTLKLCEPGTYPGGPVVKNGLAIQRPQVQSLVGN